MTEQYLSIKDFSELANVSIQSVYKRIKKEDDPIHKFIKIKDGKKYISSAAIDEIYNNSVLYDELEDNTEKESAPDQDIIELLKKQIEQQQKEIDIKNEQLKSLSKQLEESSQRETNYQKLIDQQQQLSAADKQKILQLESAADKKKRNIFNIFKKKEKGEEI